MAAAIGSRDSGGEQGAIWGVALVATPPLFYMVNTTSAYPFIREKSLEVLQLVALGDRLYYIVWAMLAAALLASVTWDALVPDRTDQQVMGVLPVSPRLVAAARLSAALLVGFVFISAVSLPAAIFYSLVSAVHPVLGPRAGIVTGQVIATIGAGLFMFTTLLTVRGVMVVFAGPSGAGRVAVVLQVATVLLLVEAFLFLPGILIGTIRYLLVPGVPEATWLVPAWFLGMSVDMGGPRREALAVMAPSAWAAAVVPLISAVLVYLVPAPVNARRAVEAKASDRPGRLGSWLTALASRIVIARPARAMLAFTLRSLARSRQHHLVMATWIGLALAMAGVRLMAAQVRGRPLQLDAPTDALVSLPLVMTFFLVGGLRTAFARPTDADANWTFRLAAGQQSRHCIAAVRAAMWLLAVAPVTSAVLVLGGWLWGMQAAIEVAAMHAVSGIFLCELAMLTCEAIPFTRQRGVSAMSVKVGAPLGLFALVLFAFRLDDLQMLALSTATGTGWYVGVGLAVTTAIGLFGARRPRPPIPVFDAPTDETTALRLSGATG
jgi:hypothetical protein